MTVLALAISSAAFGATFETRSALFALTIKSTETRYTVQVTRLDTKAVLLSEEWEPGASEITRNIGDLRVTVRLSPGQQVLMGRLDVEQGGMLIDSIQTRWMLGKPRPYPTNPFRVDGDVKAPIVLNRVEPKYTDQARKARVSGIVIVEVLIDKNGVVRDVNVLKPLPFGLSEAAIDAVRQWTFRPGSLNGQPVDVLFNVTVNFNLDALR
jgi:TonB family protein